jgi:AmmeMemoRadiSam system protein A
VSLEVAMQPFRLSLSDEDKRYLKDLVRLSIAGRLSGRGPATPPDPPSELLRRELGAFVTLKRGGQLRGCIGNIIGQGPLYRTVWDMARAAAFEDPRFRPLAAAEQDDLELEISVLGPVERCPDPQLVEIGRHGLIMRQGGRQGLLLPQVPVEWGWDREQFLGQTCRKAGLPATAWRQPQTEIYWYEAVVF